MTSFRRSFCAIALSGLMQFVVALPAVQAAPEDDARVENRKGVSQARRGNLEAALTSFEEACRVNPFDETALANLACAHNNLGVLLVKEHKYAEAIRHFEASKKQKPEDLQIRFNLLSARITMRDSDGAAAEARGIITLRPHDAETILRISTAFQKLEDDESAQQLLEELLSRTPNNSLALYQLGRLHYRQGNFAEARYDLTRSLEVDPKYPEAANLLRRIEREEKVESSFERDSSVHFNLTFEGVFPREWAHDLLDLFETAYQKSGDLLGHFPAQRAQVIVYSPADFRRVSDLPGWAGGVYDGKIRLPVPPGTSSPDQLAGAVFHEYCHHLIFLLTDGACPTWLNEGLAQLMEGLDPQRARQLLGTGAAAMLTPLEKMDGPFARNATRQQAERLYAQALVTVAQLIEDQGVAAIRELLGHLGRKRPLDEALSMVFNLTLEGLDERVRQSLD
ncbi:MAG TPA: tetratricopeptide repeat protein [Candidatus Ozemobacteraceae bacterium]|nr:tetratricopeptide repeat protein [Candidatus Ozemobacteraceae bacterium]